MHKLNNNASEKNENTIGCSASYLNRKYLFKIKIFQGKLDYLFIQMYNISYLIKRMYEAQSMKKGGM